MDSIIEKYNQYRVTRIGSIDNQHVHGNDEYLLVCDPEASSFGPIDLRTVEEAFNYHVCQDTDAPGGYFCEGVTVVPAHSKHECIVIVHHRFNT